MMMILLNIKLNFPLIACLNQIQIISLLDVFPDMTGLSLVLEFMPFTLYTKLKDDLPLSRLTIRSYTKMLLLGVEYMHELGIMHRVRKFIQSNPSLHLFICHRQSNYINMNN